MMTVMMMMMMMMKIMMLIISNNIFVISRIIKVSVSVISLGHKHHTLTLIFLDIAIPQVRESETILDSELQAMDSAFQLLVGFRSPKPSYSDSTSKLLLDSEFHKQNFLDSGIWNPDSLTQGDNWDNGDVQGCSGC